MALNKTILKKLDEKTKSDLEIKTFLQKLFEFETEPQGWYKYAYLKILEDSCKEGNQDATF